MILETKILDAKDLPVRNHLKKDRSFLKDRKLNIVYHYSKVKSTKRVFYKQKDVISKIKR